MIDKNEFGPKNKIRNFDSLPKGSLHPNKTPRQTSHSAVRLQLSTETSHYSGRIIHKRKKSFGRGQENRTVLDRIINRLNHWALASKIQESVKKQVPT